MPASALVRRVFIGLLVANLAVVGVKLWVGVASGSLAVLGGAVDSCVDALNNVVGLIVIRVAAKEPDEDHPYGHGKFETLGALAIVGFLSITCFELVREAVNHLVSGTHRVDVSNWQLGLLVLTLGVNLLITWYEHRRGTELGSELLVVDAAHTGADVFVTVGVLVSVLLMRRGWWWADSAVAIMVALVIVFVAYRILVRTVPVLVDERALPPRDIQDAAQAVPGVKSAYSIRSRGPSDLRYAEVTVCVDRHADVESAHAIADQVEERLKRDLRLHEVTVHIEEYKNALTREDLLEIGDEAVRELEESAAEQYLLTEVLLLEHVDRIIARRLRLPSFPRWRQTHRAPTHWGLESDGPLVNAVRRLEPGDLALVVGAAALPAALFIAAHDAEVFLVDHDLGSVEGAESRAVTEQLAGRFQ